MIIFHHYAIHGIFPFVTLEEYSYLRNNLILASVMAPGGGVGVALFFMISGYFQCRKARVSLEKVILTTFFYGFFSCLLFAVLCLLPGGREFYTLKGVLANIAKSALNPSTSGIWWFVTAYIVLTAASPVINSFLNRFSFKGLLFVTLFVWAFLYAVPFATGSMFLELKRAVFYYLTGACFQVHREETECKTHIRLQSLWIIGSVISWVAVGLCFFNYWKCSLVEETIMIEFRRRIFDFLANSIFVPAAALMIFAFFSALNIGSRKYLNAIAATTFGIYLLHDSWSGRPLIWDFLFDVYHTQFFSKYMFLFAPLTVFCVFVACSVIEFLRQRYIEPNWNRWFCKLRDRFLSKYTVLK